MGGRQDTVLSRRRVRTRRLAQHQPRGTESLGHTCGRRVDRSEGLVNQRREHPFCRLLYTEMKPCLRPRGSVMPGRVVLAMSGGVDSSVAAVLLKRQGYDVVRMFMRTGVQDGGEDTPAHKKGCCSAVDAGDARRVADRLDIPFYALDFEADFDRVIDYFADEYLSGRTPNPCVVCNTWLKFGKLW